eukprot:CAMPEP_0116135472 /NCGR_PEP_ID=MMETSP0329-20121206/11207_1 /TAXON_ID=697910 /ORGANISM="Pseudo-nitzschia arenysensis, Strain B593" /LENGTH=127 /DNA_ID=CAMNT_0003630271 /DNA_START=307 /DNA_END=691 /DNA_ORIENTATION=-
MTTSTAKQYKRQDRNAFGASFVVAVRNALRQSGSARNGGKRMAPHLWNCPLKTGLLTYIPSGACCWVDVEVDVHVHVEVDEDEDEDVLVFILEMAFGMISEACLAMAERESMGLAAAAAAAAAVDFV